MNRVADAQCAMRHRAKSPCDRLAAYRCKARLWGFRYGEALPLCEQCASLLDDAGYLVVGGTVRL